MSKTTAKPPTAAELETAAEWLDCYDPGSAEGGDNAAHCRAVAEWLRKQARLQTERATAKKLGVPVALARRAMAKAVTHV